VISLVTSSFRSNYPLQTDLFIEYLPRLMQGLFRILENFPPDNLSLRKDLLYFAKTLSSLVNFKNLMWTPEETQRREGQILVFKEALCKHFDDFTNMTLLFGEGRSNADVLATGNTLIQNYFNNRTGDLNPQSQQRGDGGRTAEPAPGLVMTVEQLHKTLNLLIRKCLDPKITTIGA
jgi:hypothetical protein